MLSFGHISFVALGAWTAGVLSVPSSEKPAIMPNLAGFLAHRHVGNVTSLVLAAVVGGIAAFLVGIPLMRLSGLAAGIATFAVLEITHNLLQLRGADRPRAERVLVGAGDDRAPPGGASARSSASSSRSSYARSRFGRLLRATREDDAAARAVGASVYRQRLDRVHGLGLRSPASRAASTCTCCRSRSNSVYLDLTFITLAMLVVGGATSLFGAVVGALAVSALDSWLAVAENGTSLLGWHIDLPAGTREIVVGILMAAVLILRPSGLTGGRELRLRGVPWRGSASRAQA